MLPLANRASVAHITFLGGLSVKKLWYVVALVLVLSSTGFAVDFAAQNISIGGGIAKGTLNYTYSSGDYEESSNLGYYVAASGSVRVGSIPLAFTGSYSTFSADTLTYYTDVVPVEWDSEIQDTHNASSLTKFFVGYTLPMAPISLGGGLVSHTSYWEYSDVSPMMLGSDRIKMTGFALAVFGSIPVLEKAQIGAQFIYSPVAKVGYAFDEWDFVYDPGSGFGYEVNGSYQVLPMLAVEAGYQSFTTKVRWDEDAANTTKMTTSSLFAGVKLTF
jgi:hypothetical protein